MGGNILVVDNAEYFRNLIASKYDGRVYSAQTFATAKGLLRNDGISLMVTELIDVVQEEVSIGQLVEHTRKNHAPDYFPIIAFTNLDSKEKLEAMARNLQLDVVIQKQLDDMGILYEHIERLLQNPSEFKGNPQFYFHKAPTKEPNYHYSNGNPHVERVHRRKIRFPRKMPSRLF